MSSPESADDRLQSAKLDNGPRPLFISPYHAASASIPLAFAVSKTVLTVMGLSLMTNVFDILLSYLGVILYVLSIRWLFRFNLWGSFSSFLYRYSIPRRVAAMYRVVDTIGLTVGLLMGLISRAFPVSLEC
ncbi:hypothetical protein DL93DRAFT_2084805 [Clavulina sp. PMI_390]|nr:hypothetical protein DL93DRAFT_2084805 [Clavulina sp. PMI_390]